MNIWERDQLVRQRGRHVYSGRHARIQILEIDAVHSTLWRIPHGTLLVTVLVGSCMLATEEGELELRCGVQVLLEEGESFSFCRIPGEDVAVVQCVWMPGPSVG